jgi:YD repeat-containing protein
MVAIFTGAGLGFERGSGSVLGGAGMLGQASLGRNGEQLHLNAATGNLLISQRDEFLVGRGPDAAISRTYNSLGNLSDENGDNWRQSTDRRIYGLTGALNTAGSTVRRVSADGSEILYTWNHDAYVATDGSGAHDKLIHASGTWTWTDGASQMRETYLAHGSQWRISQQIDTDGYALTFSYTGDQLTRVQTADLGAVDYVWSGNNITQITTSYQDLATNTPKTLTRTRYSYDASNRLSSVTVDLSPGDNSVADGKAYTTSYTYHGASKLVASISQTDGSSVAIGYDASNRVTSLTETVSTGVTRTTTIAYGAGYTNITDPKGQVTRLDYAVPGNLAPHVNFWSQVNVTPEAATVNGAAATRFTVQAAGTRAGISHGIDVAAGDTVTFGLTLQAVGTVTSQALGLYGSIDGSGAAGISSARIVSGPGQLVQAAGGNWTVTGLSTTQATRVEITRTYRQAETATAFVNVDQADGYRAGMSLLVQDVALMKSATATDLARMDLNNWSTGNLTKAAAGTIDGATAYKYTVQTAGAWSGVQTSLAAARGETYSFSISLKADGVYTSQSLGLYGSSSDWGSNASAAARIVSGPGTITRVEGGLFTVSGLSTTEVTRIEVTRTYEETENGWARVYVDLPGNHRAGAALIASAAHLTKRIVEPASAQQLVKITAPAAYAGAQPQTVRFAYDANGDLTSLWDAEGNETRLVSDNGNVRMQWDRLGNLVTRSFGARNELLSETRNGSNAASADAQHTTRYVYDAEHHLRYVIAAEGNGVEYRYTAAGELEYTIEYPEHYYNVSALAPHTNLTEAQVNAAVAGIADRSSTKITQNIYDARGNLASTIRYGIATAAGGTSIAEGYSRTNFTYDQAGQLLSSHAEGESATTYVYDGMGRITASTDANGGTTSFVFNDAATKTVVTLASGLVQTSTYNKAGELLSFTESGIYVSGGTTSYKYDQNGRLRQVTAATSFKTYHLYDKVGRKIADVSHYGGLTEYRYDANDRVVSATRYNKLLSSAALTQLADENSNIEIAAIRPAANGADLWTWTEYDREGRVVQTIEGDGKVTAFDYDKSGRLVRTLNYFNRLSASAVADLKLGPPIGRLRPVADAAKDGVARNFYDKEGRLIGVLDGEGYLSRIIYDRAGQKVEEVAYLNQTDAASRAAGTFNQLVSTLVTSADDRRVRYVYDGQGLLRFQVDGLNQVTKFNYNAAGRQIGTTRYPAAIGATTDYTYDNIRNMAAAAGLPGHPAARRTWSVLDAAGRVAYTIDPEGSVSGFTYDKSGNVTRSVQYAVKNPPVNAIPTLAEMNSWAAAQAGNSENRIVRNFYSAREIRFQVDAEGYITRYDHNNAGQLFSDVRWNTAVKLSDSATTATVQAAQTGTYRSQSYHREGTGKVSNVYDGEGNRRFYDYNANGTLAWDIVAYGQADESRTFHEYDGAGRLTAQYRAHGTAEQAITRYSYDGHGNLVGITDPNGNVTTRSYDRLGRMVSQTDALNGTVSYEYNAFDEVVKVTDARGSVSYNHYDKLGRLTVTRDAENYVTETGYTVFGEVASVTRRYNQADNAASVAALPTYAPHAKDATTSFLYDKLGRLVWTGDAEGHEEIYGLDAFGQRVWVQNKLENLVVNTYDRRGLLTSETLPMPSVDMWGNELSATVTNRFEYDARGNRTRKIEAHGLPEQRTTTYVYDKADRLIETWGDMVAVLSQADHVGQGIVRPVERIKYDTRGNVVETVDANGARTLLYYDRLNRKVAEIDAAGTLTTLNYDQNGNVLASRVYALAVAQPATAGGAAPAAPLSAYRETVYTYDKLDRIKTSSTAGVRTGAWDGSTYVEADGPITTSFDYDANGNVVRVTDANGNASYTYYDKLGRRTRQVDQEKYITGWLYDAEGNVTHERRWAERTGYAGLDGAWDPPVHADDRVTDFTYDRNGRRLTEQRSGVVAYDVDWSGNLIAASTTSTLTYTYNGLGQVTSKTEATGDATHYDYDGVGRLIWERKAGFYDQTGAWVRPTVRYAYDGLNNLTRTRQGTDALSGSDRVTRYSYGADGRLASMIDPEGGVFSYAYDAAGNVVREGYHRRKGAWPTGPNLIVNGSFEQSDASYYPTPFGGTNTALPGWTMLNGQNFEQHLSGMRNVAASDGAYWLDLDASPGNVEISQTIGGLAADQVMLLQFDHANGAATGSGSFEVYWNGTLVATITDRDVLMQTKSLDVVAVAGDNILTFKGIGLVDSEGASIDNVRLFATIGEGSTGPLAPLHHNSSVSSNLLVNGSFEQSGSYYTTAWGRLTATLPGWTKANPEDYELANSGFKNVAAGDGGYWLDLDASPGNMEISQTVGGLAAGQAMLLQFDHANHTTSASGSFEVYWNGTLVATITDTGTVMQTKSYQLVAVAGDNILTFKGTGTADNAGASLDNVRLFAVQAGGSGFNEAILYTRDLLGRVTNQTLASWHSWGWGWGDSQQTAYNAYGEVSQRGINNGWQEQFAYDNAGRLWRTNSGDGAWRYFLHDANGNRTLALESDGAADIAARTLDEVLSYVGINATINVYDKRGQATETRLPQRELSETAAPVDLRVSRGYNAFGELAWEQDARGAQTNFTYNTMGRTVSIQRPTVSIRLEDGTQQDVAPTDRFFYDGSGRLVGVQDANGNRTTRHLLAGTSYGDAAAMVTREFHADGGVARKEFDVFGDVRRATDEIDRATTMKYDAMGRLIEQAGPGGLIDYYGYDLLGQRTQHWNNVFQVPVYGLEEVWVEDDPEYGTGHWETQTVVVGYTPEKELTDYDLQGRVTRQVAFGGDTTRTSYTYESWIATPGMGTFGSWTQTTIHANDRYSIERSDLFGREIYKRDLGGHVTTYNYDLAGRMTQKIDGQTLNYNYLNTGLIGSITKGWGTPGTQSDYELTKTAYGYDAAGNRLSEAYTFEGGYWQYPDPYDDPYGEPQYHVYGDTYQNATATYDALGRMTSWNESGTALTAVAGGQPPASSIQYEYDANGNVRRTYAQYRTLDTNGNASSGASVKDQWYRYDAMNRVVTANGILSGGQIVRGYSGNDYLYDKAGQRVSSSRTVQAWATIVNPDYNPGGPGPYPYEPYEPYEPYPEPYITVTYDAEQREDYAYYGNGTLRTVRVGQSGYEDNQDGTLTVTAPPATGALKGSYTYDTLGRLTRQIDWLGNGANAAYDRTLHYNGKGQVYSETVATKQGSDTYTNTTSHQFGSGTGYALGAVVSSVTTSQKNGDRYLPGFSRTDYGYHWYDGAVQASVTYKTDLNPLYYPALLSYRKTYTTTYSYDGSGTLSHISVADGRPRTIRYTNDMTGQAIRRRESDNDYTKGDPHEIWYRFNGKQLGYTGNNGTIDTDYQSSVYSRTQTPGTGAFRGGASTGTAHADFDLSVDPINSYNQGSTTGSYTARGGDTLQSVAAQLWGDSSLWYKIAEANGMSVSNALAEGQRLTIPAGVMKSRHNASTFKPYDPGETIGDTSPTTPQPQKARKGKCGVFGQVLLVVIAVAVTAVTAGAATPLLGSAILGGAVGAAAGSVASQGFGVITGIQAEPFSWKAVGMAAISGGVTGGLGMAFPGGGVLGAMGRGAAANAIGQGVGSLMGLQRKFDWAGLAASTAMAGTSHFLGGKLAPLEENNSISNHVGHAGVSAAAAVAGAAARSLVDGTSFGDNILATLPDVIGGTIGDAMAYGVSRNSASAAEAPVLEESAPIMDDMLTDAEASLFPQLASADAIQLTPDAVRAKVIALYPFVTPDEWDAANAQYFRVMAREGKDAGYREGLASMVGSIEARGLDADLLAETNIDWAFIRDKEGFVRRLYWVPDPQNRSQAHPNSGVTVGTGFDLGRRDAAGLLAMGVPQSLVTRLTPYLGKRGNDARLAVERAPLTLTQREANTLDALMRGRKAMSVAETYNARSTVKFQDLAGGYQTAIASVHFQYGSIRATPTFMRQVTTQNWEGAIRNLRNFGDDFGPRRRAEAALMERTLRPPRPAPTPAPTRRTPARG